MKLSSKILLGFSFQASFLCNLGWPEPDPRHPLLQNPKIVEMKTKKKYNLGFLIAKIWQILNHLTRNFIKYNPFYF